MCLLDAKKIASFQNFSIIIWSLINQLTIELIYKWNGNVNEIYVVFDFGKQIFDDLTKLAHDM